MALSFQGGAIQTPGVEVIEMLPDVLDIAHDYLETVDNLPKRFRRSSAQLLEEWANNGRLIFDCIGMSADDTRLRSLGAVANFLHTTPSIAALGLRGVGRERSNDGIGDFWEPDKHRLISVSTEALVLGSGSIERVTLLEDAIAITKYQI